MMLVAGVTQPPPKQPELAATLRELQQETTVLLLPTLYLIGIVLVASATQFRDPLYGALLGLALYVLAIGAWGLRKLNHLAAAWMLVIGLMLIDLAFVAWVETDAAICLLALPAGLAVLITSPAGGILTATACTLLLLFTPPELVAADPGLRAVAVFEVWSTVGLIWLTLRPLTTALQWSWSSYERSRRLLERARDYQVELKQTLADLADANLQLTRLNRLAQALGQAAEDARRAKEQFVASVSHELRTPLNMILGFGEMILKSPGTYGHGIPPALLADLAVIVHNSQHLSSLVDDVLDLSQIEAGQMALTRERVTLHEIIEAATIAVRPLFASKRLYLETDVPEESTVFCDRTRIREVVINLLSNAGRFAEQGGVRLRAWREGNDFVISVADTGPGISPDDQDKLFQPFRQLDGSLRRRYGGTGLGLCISKSFVELHGGKMWVESAKGSGATFFFRLPIDPPAPLDSGVSRWFSPYRYYEERVRRSLAPVSVVRPRFVVLEHGNTLQRLLSRYLDGVQIVPATSFDEAIQELSRVPAQALLANSLSASETFLGLKRSMALPYGTPAIICSLPGLAGAASALGIFDYLVKPVSRDTLLATLDRLPLPRKTVLIVDDEPEAVQLFWRMLASADRGYRVLTASDGRQAMHTLCEEHPDVVLLDLVMPGMDGFRLLEERNQDPALRDIPVVVLSARDPAGQPIVSDSLTITRGGGLSVPQLLACIEAVSRILGIAGQTGDPVPKEELSD